MAESWKQIHEEEYPVNSAKRWATNISSTLRSPNGRRRFKAFLHSTNLPEGFQQVELWEACTQACQTMTSETMMNEKQEVLSRAQDSNISVGLLGRLSASGEDNADTAIDDVQNAIQEVKRETEDNLGNKYNEFLKDIFKRIESKK